MILNLPLSEFLHNRGSSRFSSARGGGGRYPQDMKQVYYWIDGMMGIILHFLIF